MVLKRLILIDKGLVLQQELPAIYQRPKSTNPFDVSHESTPVQSQTVGGRRAYLNRQKFYVFGQISVEPVVQNMTFLVTKFCLTDSFHGMFSILITS